jgi:hypothetical protein
LRVGFDRLTIAEVDDCQQRDDGGAEWNNMPHSTNSKRNEQSESGLRTICRGTERVQPKNRNSRYRADLLGAFFARGERPAEQQIEKARGECHAVSSAAINPEKTADASVLPVRVERGARGWFIIRQLSAEIDLLNSAQQLIRRAA